MAALSKSPLVAAAFLAARVAQAGTITVSDNLSYPNMSDTTCTLSQAIAAANVANGVGTDTIGSATTDTGTNKLGNCAGATSGANTIVFDPTLAGATLAYQPADFSSTPCPCSANEPSSYADNFWYGLKRCRRSPALSASTAAAQGSRWKSRFPRRLRVGIRACGFSMCPAPHRRIAAR